VDQKKLIEMLLSAEKQQTDTEETQKNEAEPDEE
jgi:hypothetical protein